jgi:uracil-DNA glycosylase family 4
MMLSPVSSVAEMNRELKACVDGMGFQFDCGAGGRTDATIAIVAEAPGEREVQQRVPLIGGSGKYLWDIVRKDGITRNDVYITNVVKRKLVSAADGYAVAANKQKIVVTKQEKSGWRHILHEELSRLPRLEYVVALGNYALEALTGLSGITDKRGSVFALDLPNNRRVQVLCTYNPAHVMREPRMEIVFRMDINKLKRLREGTFSVPRIDALINPTYTEACDFIRYAGSLDTPLAYDIETMAGETACVGFAPTDDTGMCINFRSQGENHYTLEQERDIRLQIQSLLSAPHVKLVAQNGHYDASWLWFKDRIRVHAHWFDTMLAHHFLYPSLPHNLGFITAQYTDHPHYKDDGQLWKEEGDIDAFWRYNVTDCCITRIAAGRMEQELIEAGLHDTFHNHVMKLQPQLVEMTCNGVTIDRELKDRFADELGRQLEQARELCQAKARVATGIPDYDFNPRSPPQLADLLFGKLQLVGRGNSVDKENRDRIKRHPRTAPAARELVEAIDSFLQQARFVSNYVGAKPDHDGRWRCDYKQTGVASAPGRLSSGQTSWDTGLNYQNIPEQAKPMFIAPQGWEFSYYDMSQIEARFVACLAHIPVWLSQFEQARLHPGTYDAHCALASEMFKVPYEQVPQHDRDGAGGPTIRYIAKRCRHGLNYRMAPDRLATVTGLSAVEAEQAYRLYHMATPQITVWWDDLVALVRRDRSITTALGRRWMLLEHWSDEALDSIVAFEPQSLNGDWTSSVIYKCHGDKEWPPTARILINVHDANIALNRHEDGPAVRAIMRKYAEQPIYINSVQNRLAGRNDPTEIIVPAEFGVSQPDENGVHRWSTIRKLK